MSLITSPELFINMKSYPKDKTSSEYKPFWEYEKEKVTHGVTINGTFISGWLYWHLNHWKLVTDLIDDKGYEYQDIITPGLRDNEWIFAEAEKEAYEKRKALCILGLRQFGKDLLNSSLLYKEEEEITIGNCKIGDKIYDESGNLTTIIAKFPQGLRDVYTLELADGRKVNAGLEHNWTVYDRIKRKWFVKSTQELIVDYKIHRSSWSHRKVSYEMRYYIPNNSPINYPKKDLTIDPYFLGLWLGDGNSNSTSITSIDPEIIDYLQIICNNYEDLSLRYNNKLNYHLTSSRLGKGRKLNKNPLLNQFNALNLLNNKHIPEIYLKSSINQRLELLQGLMDTDGWCDKNGQIGYCTTSKQLANDFYKLCRSLGIIIRQTDRIPNCYVNNKKIPGKKAYYFALSTLLPIFKLERKLKNLYSRRKRTLDKIGIRQITYFGKEETTCITVDNKSHLFLTDNYTVTHNSSILASYAARSGTINRNSQNIIVGANAPDLNSITFMMDTGMLNVTPYFRIPRITRDWGADEVLLGVKNKKGDNIVYSRFRIRNTQGGRNTEVVAGTTIKCLIFDEIGKGDFLQTYNAAKPALKGPNGWRCSPILTGTGGAFEKSKDAEIMFFDPDSNDVLDVVDELTGQKRGLFLPGYLRQDCKKETLLSTFLGKETGTELDIPMKVSDIELATSKIQEERIKAAQNPDPKTLLKEKMYHPITADEVFLSESNAVFPPDLVDDQIKHINAVNFKPLAYVDLYRDSEGTVKHKHTDKKPVPFPVVSDTSVEGVFTIYEFPLINAPFGLYVAGTDPYKQSLSAYSDSVGATYIYKRIHNIFEEKMQDVLVASYIGRPKSIHDWYENTKLLLDFYKAKTACENMDYGFIQHCIEKNVAAKYLATTLPFIKEVHPNTTVQRIYGVHMTRQIKEHLVNLIKEYMTEEISVERDEKGNATKTVLGIKRIVDPFLLKEMKIFDYKANTDRVIAFGLALAYAKDLNKSVGKTNTEDNRYKSYGKKKISTIKSKLQQGLNNPFKRS